MTIRPLVVSLLVAGTLAGLVTLRWSHPDANRPLEYDEWVSLEYYTWVGLESDGQMREIRRADQLAELDDPSPFQLAAGMYRATGVWLEPNNHVLHSALLNLVSSRTPRTPQFVRLTALAGAAVFAFACFALFYWGLRWRYAAAFAAVWAFSLPYVVRFSLEARGYSLMLALQVIFLTAAWVLARRPASVPRAAVMSITAAATFMNVVSLAVDWLLPAYFVLWLVPPAPVNVEDPQETRHRRRQWRTSLFAQMLAIGSVGLVFLMDRLPYVVSSAQQYGNRVLSVAEFGRGLLEIGRDLFPGPVGMVVFVAGAAGLLLMPFRRADRSLGLLALAVVAVSLLHFWGTHKLPYARTCGYILPLAIAGLAFLVERICWAINSTPLRFVTLVGILTATAGMAWQTADTGHWDHQALAQLEEQSTPADEPVYVVLPAGNEYWFAKYLPQEWQTAADRVAAERPIRHVALWVDESADWSLATDFGPAAVLPESWRTASAPVSQIGRTYRIVSLNVQPIASDDLDWQSQTSPVFAVWWPDPSRIGLSGQGVASLLQDNAVPAIRRIHRVPAKLDFYGQLNAIEFFALTSQDRQLLGDILEDAVETFGGEVQLFTVTTPDSRTEVGAAGPVANLSSTPLLD
ncbi:hypothetical protein Mal4_13750 [Maioricimonas rarisocia]|uniref:Glycosyltransferase RgtA/B/C/D-like domain-containing protein n=1 Tax=Maioricimonas rarisocia TaxID=2528026 RepID=A0A517Z3K5_9PLAN|nr:hypothetical protein [Maioricimonas rarisocia]QDU37072.1 hypothetical protein Mal4_13750 [Maioricimonas rarisocia]